MNKILVLGSDYNTINVVKEAHRMGIYVVVSDLMESSPTKTEADEAWMISTTDIDLLEKKCRDNNINAVMFGASDFNINNARELCHRLRLPIYCSEDFAWDVARNKRIFKDICKRVGAPIAEDYRLDDDLLESDLKKVKFPVVCKPCDKSGNRGMNYCSNIEELREAYKAAREISDKDIIVERQLHGKEYNVHYVLADGEARLLYFSSTHHEPGQSENLYSFKCTTSAFLKQYLTEVNELVKKVITESKCKEGIVWFDCIRDDDGHFYLLEMGHRFGGVMTYVPYEKVFGFNTIKWMIECSLGIKHTVKDLPNELNTALRGCAASYHLFSTCEGEIKKMLGLERLTKEENVYLDLPKREGNTIRNVTCSGLIGIYGSNIEEICNIVNVINSNLKMINVLEENMFIYFDDFKSLKDEYYQGINEFEAQNE